MDLVYEYFGELLKLDQIRINKIKLILNNIGVNNYRKIITFLLQSLYKNNGNSINE